jgi:hypothetical protein
VIEPLVGIEEAQQSYRLEEVEIIGLFEQVLC